MVGCFIDGYIDSLLQFSVDENGDSIHSMDWTDDIFTRQALEIVKKECQKFYLTNVEDLTEFCNQSKKFLNGKEDPLDFDDQEMWMIAGSDFLWSRNKNEKDGRLVGFISRDGVDCKLRDRLNKNAVKLGKSLASIGLNGLVTVSQKYHWGKNRN